MTRQSYCKTNGLLLRYNQKTSCIIAGIKGQDWNSAWLFMQYSKNTGGETSFFPGKTAHDLQLVSFRVVWFRSQIVQLKMTRTRVLHCEMELIFPSPRPSPKKGRGSKGQGRKNRQVSGSPPGVPSPDYLSLRIKTLLQGRVSNYADNDAKDGESCYCERL